MVVNLDTERLQEMAGLLLKANNNIDRATELLRSITTHQNWACKERYTINDHILNNRTRSIQLQENCQRFCTVTKQVADEFVETESGIAQMFPGVETAIAAILANPVSSVVINQRGILERIKPPSFHDYYVESQKRQEKWKIISNAIKNSGAIPIAHKPTDWTTSPIQRISVKDLKFNGE